MKLVKGNTARTLVLFGLAVGAAGASAATDVSLRVDSVTIPAGAIGNPDPIRMWRFVQTDVTFATPPPSATGWAPGPMIVANEGGTLNIHLLNNLPAASPSEYAEPVSVVIPGQRGDLTPTWTDGSTGQRTSLDQRVRSFTSETPQGSSSTYSFGPLKAGTYLFQSGTHPAIQLQMGLYGVLKVLPTIPGRAYQDASSAFDNEAVLLLSEIDPALHKAVGSGQYGPNGAPPAGWLTSTIDYHPRYFLVNGLPYPSTAPITAGPAYQKLLVRFANAGLLTKVPTLLGPHMSVIAEDGNFLSVTNTGGTVVAAPRYQYNVMLPAGKTMDAILTPMAAGSIPVFDRRLNLTNNGSSPGGILTYLESTSALPAPWVDQDVGAVGQAGWGSFLSGTFTVNGSGAGIAGTADQFHFVYQGLSGDGEIKARVLSVQHASGSSMAGVMIREGLAANATQAFMGLRTDGRGFFRRRLSTGGATSSNESTLAIPYWVRLVRSGNTFTAYRSSSGSSWTAFGSPVTIPMGVNVFIGLAGSSSTNFALSSSTFSNVLVTQAAPSNHAPTVTNPGNKSNVENDSVTLPITAVDTDGDVLTYGASGLPPGLTIHANTGVISGTISATASSGSPYSVTVTATDPSTASGSASFSWTVSPVASGGLPVPWVQQDIGAVGQAGSGSFSSGTFTVSGSGAGIAGTADQFHFVYQALSGNGEIKARVLSVQNASASSMAGVMIRESLAANAAQAWMGLRTDGRGFFRRRLSTGGATSSNESTLAIPYWVRLVRSGNTFTAYRSSSGSSWTAFGSPVTIPMGSNVLIGLAVSSSNNSTLNTSTIANVTIVQGP